MNDIHQLYYTSHHSVWQNKHRNDNLEQQAQALYKSWFIDFEPFKDGKFVDSELGMIPEGWKVAEFKELVIVNKKAINPQKHPKKLFLHYSLPACDNAMQPEKQYGSEIMSNKTVIENNTILFSKLNPRIKRIWFTSKVKDNSVCSTEFIPYKSKIDTQYPLVFSIINSEVFYGLIMRFVNGATGSHQRFHVEDTLKLKFATNEDVIDKYCKLINPIMDKIYNSRLEMSKLSAIRDYLLPKLMSGELKINDLNS